ncbi:MAG: helix-turn-helix transcriptional regulator [Prevotella sp.]|nr:helix-turn-helix transcriptional regulator [Prevotella sp.]MBR1840300.1 helix-turn-helix transcriptional regulator [Prevotella sp.]
MKKMKVYEPDDKMLSLIRDNYNVLQSLGAFGISLGFGDKTVRQVCEEGNVDTFTFLAVVNLTINGYHSQSDVENLDVRTLLRYLRASHEYYLGFQLPFLRRELSESLDEGDSLGRLILKIYDEYARFISHHMHFEEQTLFPYVEGLLNGERKKGYDIETFSKHHDQTGEKLKELKSIIIKYLPSDSKHNNMLTAALHDIFNLEEWLTLHASVEEKIFEPAIALLESKTEKNDNTLNITRMLATQTDNGEQLSEREKDVVVGVVQGLTNKEIADKLFIAPNTVITHRRNIARKLQIHSTAGLTIYAIVNRLVDIGSVDL